MQKVCLRIRFIRFKLKPGVAGSSGRKLNQNKLLSKSAKLNRFNPIDRKCRLCKTKVNQDNYHYCQGEKIDGPFVQEGLMCSMYIDCAYKKGICAMCGKQVLDTSSYKQSTK